MSHFDRDGVGDDDCGGGGDGGGVDGVAAAADIERVAAVESTKGEKRK